MPHENAMAKDKKVKAKKGKLTESQQIERFIRAQYYPEKFGQSLSEILDIEANALWLKTKEGLDTEGYTKEEAASIMQKQATRREVLLKRVNFYRAQIDKKG